MFATHDHARIAMPGLPPAVGRQHWSKIEVPLFVPFLMVTYRAKPGVDDDCQVANTELLASVEDLITAACLASRQGAEIDAVCLICPAHLSGEKYWGMYPLSEISVAFEQEAPAQVAYIYQTTTGEQLVSSLLSTPAEKLVRIKRLFTFKDPSFSTLAS